MIDISELKFDENGLIPAVVTDADSGAVLTLAYMNKESLKISMEERRTCFWSRSRGELWRKGETSGNVQHIVDIKADCDRDALIVAVKKDGPACHTGADSCFNADVYSNVCGGANASAGGGANASAGGGANASAGDEGVAASLSGGRATSLASGKVTAFTLDTLYDIISDRKTNPKPGSYTTYLFEKGVDKILKKLGEESTEVIIAGKSGDKAETVYEIADLAYHAMVLMAEMDITTDDVKKELESRHVVDKKVKQEKMT